MNRPLRYLSLFSGVGGFDLGFDRAGMECAGQVEYDEKARAVLARHWPDVKRINDVREVQGNEFGAIDVITGGFPCQDLSVAGKRAGLSGERSGLFFEIIRIIKELREETNGRYPNFVVLENVPGLLSSHGGRDFALVLSALAESGALDIAWAILDAQWFGVPQRRRRVFIVADFRGQRAAEILSIPYGGSGDIAEGRSARPELARDVAASLKGSSGERGFPLDFEAGLAITPYVMAHGQANAEIVKDGSPSLTLNHEAPIVTAFNGYTGGPDDNDAQGGHLVMAFQPRYYTRDNKTGGQPREIADITNAHKAGDSAPHVVTYGVRRLTPVECERLQGFPDGHTAGQSDSARYRQMGNAVAVPVVEWLGRRIVAVEAMENGQ